MIPPTEITEISQGREADNEITGERKYVRVFRVAYSQATAGPGQAIIDQLVRYFQVYQEPGGFIDEAALATGGSAAPEDAEASFNHLVSIRYSTRWWDEIAKAMQSGGVGLTGPRPGGGGGGQPESNSPANPLARPPVYSWGKVYERQLLDYAPSADLPDSNVCLRTTAGVPFDPPLETEQPLLTCTVERNTLTYDPVSAETAMGCSNSFNFSIAGTLWQARQVKCEDWTAKTEYENGIAFWAERLFFIFKRGRLIPNSKPAELSGWRRVVLNAGLHQLGNDGKLTPIVLRGGVPVQKPWPLDANGKKLADNYADTDLVYRTYIEFPEIDFSIFGKL